MNIERKTAHPSLASGSQSLIVLPFRMVFSKWHYFLITFISALIFWIVSSIFDQLLFFSLIIIFYLPDDSIIGFVLTSISLGIVISMNVYIFKHTKLRIKTASFFGVAASNLSNYQTPLHLVSIALLVWAYYSASTSIVKNCKIDLPKPE